jgi:hypothetical protein
MVLRIIQVLFIKQNEQMKKIKYFRIMRKEILYYLFLVNLEQIGIELNLILKKAITG